jgi:DNA-binding XRE family transcriptional regulator
MRLHGHAPALGCAAGVKPLIVGISTVSHGRQRIGTWLELVWFWSLLIRFPLFLTRPPPVPRGASRSSSILVFCSIYRGAYVEQLVSHPHMDLRDVFARNLRRLRNAKGLSQDDLAYEAGVSRSYLSQLEKGSFYASLKIIERLSLTLDVEPAKLLELPANHVGRSMLRRRRAQ